MLRRMLQKAGFGSTPTLLLRSFQPPKSCVNTLYRRQTLGEAKRIDFRYNSQQHVRNTCNSGIPVGNIIINKVMRRLACRRNTR